jgi:hypothetical protein
MKKTLIIYLLALIAGTGLIAQPSAIEILNSTPLSGKAFSDCAAIFYKGEMLVNEYSPNGICKIEKGMKGKITLSAVELDEKGGKAIRSLSFKVAIKDNLTNTIMMYSDKEYQEIMVEDLLPQRKKGDKIIIMTLDPAYALPHNEIEIVEGC